MLTVTYIMLGIMFIIYLTPINFYNTANDLINYQIRSYYHANLSHLIANGVSFYGLSSIEKMIGSGSYFIAIIFISVVSSLLLYFYHKMIPSRKVYTVGFSGIVFGLIVVYLSLMGGSMGLNIAGLIITILPQIVVPGISWEGHICGIIAGIIYVAIFRPKKFLNNKLK